MAIKYGDGKAGQFAKSQAQKRFDRLVFILAWGLALFSLSIGIAVGCLLMPRAIQSIGFLHRRSSFQIALLGVALEFLLVGIALIISRLFRHPLQELSRKRIYWLRGGQAEGLVAWILSDLPDDWHLFNNIVLKSGGDIDHILVGPAGVFCISTKSTKGVYKTGPAGELLLNGVVTDHSNEAAQLAMKVRNWLEVKLHDEVSTSSIPWVQAVLVNPFARIDMQSRAPKLWVMDAEQLYSELLNERTVLGKSQIKVCADAIQAMSTSAPVPTQLRLAGGQ